MQRVQETADERLKASAETKQQIYEFLKTHPIGVLSTTDEDGAPCATVIYFNLLDDFSVTFATKKETRKHQNLQRDPRVMLVAYEPASQTTVQIKGRAEVIDDPNEANQAIDSSARIASKTSDSGQLAINKLEAGSPVSYRLLPTEIRMAVFARPDPGGYDIYETISFEPFQT